VAGGIQLGGAEFGSGSVRTFTKADTAATAKYFAGFIEKPAGGTIQRQRGAALRTKLTLFTIVCLALGALHGAILFLQVKNINKINTIDNHFCADVKKK
jgi:hypothetical protein